MMLQVQNEMFWNKIFATLLAVMFLSKIFFIQTTKTVLGKGCMGHIKFTENIKLLYCTQISHELSPPEAPLKVWSH